jgi:hypothetical protein
VAKRRDDQAPYWRQLRAAERSIIEYALGHGRSVLNTANLLGVSPNYLRLRIQRLGIPLPTRPGLRPGPKAGLKSEFRLKKMESSAEALGADNGVGEEEWEETEALAEHDEEEWEANEEEWEASEDDADEWDEEFDDDADDNADDADDDDDDADDDDSNNTSKNAKTEAESGPTTTD